MPILELLLGESKYVEYKRDYTKTLLKTVSTFANYHDGHILIGIADDGTVVGVDSGENVRLSVENAINDAVKPRPYYEIVEDRHNDKVIVVVKVYKGDHTPYTFDNKAYKRMDTSSVQVDRHAFEELILLGRNLSFEMLSSEIQKLSFGKLEEKLRQVLNVAHFTEDLLVTLRLKNNEQYNNAAALLSDTSPLASSRIQLIAYDNEGVSSIRDRLVLESISVLEQFDKCMEFYRKHINISEIIKDPYRETTEEIPLVAYREAVANAIVHRDYSRQADLRLEIFSNRIEVISPGGLPVGISESEYLEGRVSIPRNQILADMFLRLKIIEKLATGIRRIKEYYRDYAVNPEFEIHENSITVILPKTNQAKARTYRPVELDVYELNENERLIYKLLESGDALSRASIEKELGLKKSQTIDLLSRLRELNLVAQIGRGRSTKYLLTSKHRTN